jgi:hypothetical protein
MEKGSTNLVNGTNIAGATSSTLTSRIYKLLMPHNYNVITERVYPLTSNNSILVINRLVAINTSHLIGVCVSNPATFGIKQAETD